MAKKSAGRFVVCFSQNVHKYRQYSNILDYLSLKPTLKYEAVTLSLENYPYYTGQIYLELLVYIPRMS